MDQHVKNLVIIASGVTTLHLPWLKDHSREFDVFTVDFSSDCVLKDKGEDFYLNMKGFKPQLVACAIEQLGDTIHDYERICLPDDDLFIRAESVNRMFKIAHKHNFDICQPALTKDSYFSHRITLKIPLIECHFTNFVEVMAPIFKTPILLNYLDTFRSAKTGWGLDVLWQHDAQQLGYKMGIIDSTPITHTRPINAPLKSSTSKTREGIYKHAGDPLAEMDALMSQHGIHSHTKTMILGARANYGISIPARLAKAMTPQSRRFKAK